ncbi:MAG TPA: AsmA-like C-terminal region-containing protein [Candidatus Dormibacteraeota bacterium]|nr:AsmA-like C-terminal region-containing protein [Candidatus Dormibacteraeota bacterium]
MWPFSDFMSASPPLPRPLRLVVIRPCPETSRVWARSFSSSGRTAFDSFKASAELTNGVALTKDLNIASQNLRVTGQGTANLPTQAIDYQVRATLLKQAPGAAKTGAAALADVPLTITGTMASPKVRPDLEGMAKARVQQELDKHKDELKQKVQDKLKDFLK